MRLLEHRIPPPVIGALVAAAMWGVSDLGPQFAIAAGVRLATVALLALAGVAFDVMGLLAFRTLRTTVNPLAPEKATAMVTHGVYRISRNPMYVGMALLLSAWAVHLAALLPFAGPLVFVFYITRFQILPEERALRALFKDEYVAYAAKVRRWI